MSQGMPRAPGLPSGRTASTEEETSKRDTADHYRERIENAAGEFSEYWNRVEENFKFVSGGKHQWDQADWKRRKQQKQPALSMNDTALAVNGMSGREATQRFKTGFQGRNLDEEQDQRWAEVLREVDRWTLDLSHAADLESDAFRDLLIGGAKMIGWTVDYMEHDWRGVLIPISYDIWQCIWDPLACKPCRVDREWDATGQWVSLDECLAMFPDKADEIDSQRASKAVWIPSTNETTGGSWPWVYRAEGQYYDRDRQAIFLTHYQWKERTPAYLVQQLAEDGSVNPDALEKLSKDEFEEYREQYISTQEQDPDFVGPRDGFFDWRYYEAYFTGPEPLFEREIPYGQFTRQIMTGIPDKSEQRNGVQSLVDLMKDGQRFKNAVLSYSVSHFSRGRKGGMIYTEDTFGPEGEEALATMASVPEPTIPARAGTDLKQNVLFLGHNEFPNAADKLIDLAEQSAWRATGLNPNTLGQMQDLRRVSGRVFSGVAEAGDVVLSTFFTSLRTYRKISGRLRLAMYEQHFDRDRFARIVGPAKAEKIPQELAWEDAFEFDVIVDEAETNKSEQLQLFDFFTRTDLFGQMMMSGMMPPEIFVQMIPSSAITESDRQMWLSQLRLQGVQKIQAMLEEMMEKEPEAVIQAAQMAVQYAQAVQQQGGGEQGGGEQ